MLNITKQQENEKLILILEGTLDTMTAPEFDAEIEPLLPGAKEILIDLKTLDYISSAGLRSILTVTQHLTDHDCPVLKIKNCSPVIRETFEMTGFDQFLEFC